MSQLNLFPESFKVEKDSPMDPEPCYGISSLNVYFGRAVKQREIDPAIGRNVMLNILRFLGFLTRDHRPVQGSPIFNHLMARKREKNPATRIETLPYHQLDITDEGILIIIKAIEEIRKKGGTI